MSTTLPREITHTDTEWVKIEIPDNVIEFLESCAPDDCLVEVEPFVSGVSLGRKGQRVSGGMPIRCKFEWHPVGIRGVLHRSFKCWLNGERVGPGQFYGLSPVLDADDVLKLYLHLDI